MTLVGDQMLLLRHYLRMGRPQTGRQLLEDALDRGEPGALALLDFGRQLRSNKRTRRSMDTIRAEHRRQRRARWYSTLGNELLQLYRTMRRMALPQAQPINPIGSQLARSTVRELAATGTMDTREPERRLQARADEVAAALWASLPGRQAILWMDNDYRERWGTDPARVNLSLNITALSILFLDMDVAGAVATRASRIPDYRGHLTTARLVGRVRDVAALLASSMTALQHNVRQLNAMQLGGDSVRVPLDVHRTGVRALPWRPCLLSEYQVSSNEDLLVLLQMAADLQERTRVPLPLLLDENIHYRVLRLMHSVSHKEVDVAEWLSRLPLLYGIWHPYKHAVGVVYRAFLPVIGLLEGSGHPAVGDKVVPGRKVLYMEKVVAALLIIAPDLRDRLEAKLSALRQALQTPPAPPRPDGSSSSAAGAAQPPLAPDATRRLRQELALLQGLHTLLYFYCPVLFQMGWKVRQCTWEGRPTQSVKGDVAKQVLHHAFLLMTHVQGDLECREEYPRTIAMALLTWQPWHSSLPSSVLPTRLLVHFK